MLGVPIELVSHADVLRAGDIANVDGAELKLGTSEILDGAETFRS